MAATLDRNSASALDCAAMPFCETSSSCESYVWMPRSVAVLGLRRMKSSIASLASARKAASPEFAVEAVPSVNTWPHAATARAQTMAAAIRIALTARTRWA